MQTELQNYPNKQEQRLIRSYGRIKSRKLSDHKKFLLEEFLPKYEILKTDFSRNDFVKKSFEIGFGFGDFLYGKAQSATDQLFLGSEPHLNGVVNLLQKLENQDLTNIKISRDDARELLMKFPQEFFDEIYILFPDPWPKYKHFKRRLITQEFLDFLAQKIKKSGKIIIATDHDSYKTWILAEILKSSQVKWSAASKHDWQKFPHDWVETKYQKKAINEGRVPVIFKLEKA